MDNGVSAFPSSHQPGYKIGDKNGKRKYHGKTLLDKHATF